MNKDNKTIKEKIKDFSVKILIRFIQISILPILFYIDNHLLWWILGWAVVNIGMSLYLLKDYRDHFMFITRMTETNIFGKPLDKEYWEKGEKKPKLKFRLFKTKKKKKEENSNDEYIDLTKQNYKINPKKQNNEEE